MAKNRHPYRRRPSGCQHSSLPVRTREQLDQEQHAAQAAGCTIRSVREAIATGVRLGLLEQQPDGTYRARHDGNPPS